MMSRMSCLPMQGKDSHNCHHCSLISVHYLHIESAMYTLHPHSSIYRPSNIQLPTSSSLASSGHQVISSYTVWTACKLLAIEPVRTANII